MIRTLLLALVVGYGCTTGPAVPPPPVGELNAAINAERDLVDWLVAQGIIHPRSCGGGCSLSSTCRDGISKCGVCYQGTCSEILPAGIPDDAGVTTSKGTAP